MGTLTFACGLASCVFAAYLAWLAVAQRRLLQRLQRLEQFAAAARHDSSDSHASSGIRLAPDTCPAHSDSLPRAEFIAQRDAARRRAA